MVCSLLIGVAFHSKEKLIFSLIDENISIAWLEIITKLISLLPAGVVKQAVCAIDFYSKNAILSLNFVFKDF